MRERGGEEESVCVEPLNHLVSLVGIKEMVRCCVRVNEYMSLGGNQQVDFSLIGVKEVAHD